MKKEALERLSVAIVAQAVKDCAKDIKKEKDIAPYIRFFNSEYCYMLSGVEPNWLVEMSNKLAERRR